MKDHPRTVGVDDSSLQLDSQPESVGLSEDRQLIGTVLHSSDESGELSQSLSHNDSAINIG